jgi:hypothetical protein
MATAAKNKMMEDLKRDLFSGNDATVMKALIKCRDNGNASMVEPLIAFYAQTKNPTFKQEIKDMLSTLKVTGVDEAFIDALENETYKAIHKDLLMFMWSSGLQPVDGIDLITKMAIQGPFDVTFEALTLLESIEDPIEEEVMLESITAIKQYLGSSQSGDHRGLMVEYLRVLQSLTEAGNEGAIDDDDEMV